MTYENIANELSLTTSTACDIGFYTSPAETISFALIPSESPKIMADEVYTFDITITCVLTSFTFPMTLEDVTITWQESYVGNSFHIDISPTHCLCAPKVVFTVTFELNGTPISNPAFIASSHDPNL